MKKEFIDKVIKNGVVDTKKYRYIYSVSAEKAEIRRIAIDLLDTTATINSWEVVKVIDDGSNQFGICACIRSVESSRDLIAKGDVEKVFAYLSGVETKNGSFFNKTMWDAFDIVFPGYRDSLETTETETTETETETTETVSNRRQYVATFMDGLDASIRVEFLEATDEKHARYKAQHMAGMFETVENVREVDSNDFEEISGVTVPGFVDVMTHDEISGTIDALKKAVAPIDDAMEVDNVSLEEWQEMSAKSAAVWEKIGLLQYVLYIPGVQRFQTERRFYNTESGDVLTLEDLLLCWSQHKCLREGWPRFGWYVAACQTYQGGTLEEIK